MAVDFPSKYQGDHLHPAGVRRPPSPLAYTLVNHTGSGILAGTFPDGLTTIEGEPTPATVRVLYRPEPGAPGDGVVVAEVQSNQDGTWIVEGLNPNLKFDVVGRKSGFNDVIMANVSPYSEDIILLSGGFEVVKPDRNRLEGGINVSGGVAPYSVSVVGTAPAGIQFAYLNGMVEVSGTTWEWGDFDFTLRVTDANGVWAETSVELFSVDGQWDKVVALLHFDGDLVNEAGVAYSARKGVTSFAPGLAGQSVVLDGQSSLIGEDYALASAPFTVELFFKLPDGPLPAGKNTYMVTTSSVDYRGGLVMSVRSNTGDGNTYLYAAHGVGGAEVSITGTTPVADADWHHFALVSDAMTLRIYLDGVSQGEIAASPSDVGARPVLLGEDYNSASRFFTGLLDELRITKGLARYTEDFTPPKAPF